MYQVDQNYFFLKIGAKRYMEELFTQGKIYCNTFEYFTKIENEQQKDINETTFNLRKGTLQRIGINDGVGDKRYLEINIPATLREFYTGHIGNLFCLYSFKHSDLKEDDKFELPDDIHKFGDTVVLILNIQSFLSRIEVKLKEKNKSIKHGFVEYLNFDNLHGMRSPFQKDIHFSHQNEYRLYLLPKEDEQKESYHINIGDLSDIAIIKPLKDFSIYKSIIKSDNTS